MSPAAPGLPASKTRINKAGDALRRAAVGEQIPAGELREHLDIVRAYRAYHGYPLTSVTMSLRHHAQKAADGSWFDLGQRLKQLATIRDKLARLPGTNLARMQDIGGCRATFLDQRTVDSAIASIEQRAKRGTWKIVDIDDYVHEIERRDGYRAKHVIVLKHGVQIEIQFRTFAQHSWAQLVEDLDTVTGLGLKQGRAPEWAVEAVAQASSEMRRYELGAIDRETLVAALSTSLRPILELSTTGATIR